MIKSPAQCLYCEKVSEDVTLVHAMTAYSHDMCEHEDCLRNEEMRRLCYYDRNPNKDLLLCASCAEDYREFWNEQWNNYYRGLL